MINNVTVTKIGGNVFTDCADNSCGSCLNGLGITSVIMPDAIEEIGYYTFNKDSSSSNPNLTTIINLSGNSSDWYNITRHIKYMYI